MLGCGILAAPLSAATLLNDGFDNGSIGPQSLPDTAQWYGSTSDNVTASTGSMTLSTAGGTTSGLVTAYFTDSGTVSLNSGETLTLSFVFSVTGVDSSVGYFRFGLFDSGGSRLTEQGQGAANSLFNNYSGYATLTNLDSDGSNIGLNKRDNLPNNALLGTTSAYSSLGSTGANFTLENNTTYTSTLTLTYTGTSIIMTQSITGGSLSGITHTLIDDSGSLFTEFDTVAISIQSAAANTITFDNINVSVIPEPAASSFIMTVLILGALAIGRSRFKRRG